jgi:hypothetical protein
VYAAIVIAIASSAAVAVRDMGDAIDHGRGARRTTTARRGGAAGFRAMTGPA